MHVPEIQRALDRLEPLPRSVRRELDEEAGRPKSFLAD